MEDVKNIIDLFKIFGLTKYQSLIYIELMKSFRLTAQEIIDQTSVPRSKVYEALDYLVDHDWVKKIDGRPMIYEANHYSIIFEKHKNYLNDQISRVEDTLREMWEIRDLTPFQGMQSLRNKSSIINLTQSMLNRAKMNIFFNLGYLENEEKSELLSKLADLKSRGIQVRLLIYEPIFDKLDETGKKELNLFDLRKSKLPTRVLIVDNRELLMNLPFPLFEKDKLGRGRGMGMYINDESFLKFFEQTVNLVWNSSQNSN